MKVFDLINILSKFSNDFDVKVVGIISQHVLLDSLDIFDVHVSFKRKTITILPTYPEDKSCNDYVPSSD